MGEPINTEEHTEPHIHPMAPLQGQQSSGRNSQRAHNQQTSVNSLEDPLWTLVHKRGGREGRTKGDEDRRGERETERVKDCS